MISAGRQPAEPDPFPLLSLPGLALGLERCDVVSRRVAGQIPCYQIRKDVGG